MTDDTLLTCPIRDYLACDDACCYTNLDSDDDDVDGIVLYSTLMMVMMI